MAVTITGTQVQFPSSGNMEGLYTGATVTNASYPIGTYQIAYNSAANQNGVRNASYTVWSPTTSGTTFGFNVSAGSGSVTLAGTWVSRGAGWLVFCGPPVANYVLVQRIA